MQEVAADSDNCGVQAGDPCLGPLPVLAELNLECHLASRLGERSHVLLEHVTVSVVERDCAKLGIPKAVAAPFPLERRIAGAAGKNMLEGAPKVFQRLLQRLRRGILSPGRIRLRLPLHEMQAHVGVGDVGAMRTSVPTGHGQTLEAFCSSLQSGLRTARPQH